MISYVVARDFGFAPNPFYGVCTLATCKPQIRKAAAVGDWIIGTGSATYGLADHLIYAMLVSEAMGFDAYWEDPRFRRKRPNLAGSLKQLYGDNIYHRGTGGAWAQEDSHHSLEHGPNLANIMHDTQIDRVLVGTRFAYWGGAAPLLPPSLRGREGVCKVGPGHRHSYGPGIKDEFMAWLVDTMQHEGYLGDPAEFRNHDVLNQLKLFRNP